MIYIAEDIDVCLSVAQAAGYFEKGSGYTLLSFESCQGLFCFEEHYRGAIIITGKSYGHL